MGSSREGRHHRVLNERTELEYYRWAITVPVGVQILEARQALDLTQEDFGAASGFCGTTICAFEKGWKMPHGNGMIRLAKLMETPLILSHEGSILRDHTHTPRPYKKQRIKAIDPRRPPSLPGKWVDSNYVAAYLGTTRSNALRRMHRAGIKPTMGKGMPKKFWYLKDKIMSTLSPLNRNNKGVL